MQQDMNYYMSQQILLKPSTKAQKWKKKKNRRTLTMFPYSHKVLFSSVFAPNSVHVRVMLLQWPELSHQKSKKSQANQKSEVKRTIQVPRMNY